jgi:hypothetical protein
MALVDDFSCQLNNGFVINDGNPTSYPTFDLHTIQGLDSAPFRTTVRDREGTDGAFVDAEYAQARTIVLQGVLYDDCDHTELTLDQLKGEYQPSRVPLPFHFRLPGIGERMVWVIPQGLRYDLTQLRRLGLCEVSITLIAGDPRIYAAFETTRELVLSDTIQTGFGFPLAFDFGFGGITGVADPGFVVNLGNRSTPVRMLVHGPIHNPHIVNETVGRQMVFDLDIATGEWLEIDSAARTIRTSNGENRRYALRAPAWFDLVPGDNVIRLQSEGGTSVDTRLEVRFRSAWE